MSSNFKHKLDNALMEYKYLRTTEAKIAQMNNISRPTLSKYVNLKHITRLHSAYKAPKKPAKRKINNRASTSYSMHNEKQSNSKENLQKTKNKNKSIHASMSKIDKILKSKKDISYNLAIKINKEISINNRLSNQSKVNKIYICLCHLNINKLSKKQALNLFKLGDNSDPYYKYTYNYATPLSNRVYAIDDKKQSSNTLTLRQINHKTHKHGIGYTLRLLKKKLMK